jgi:leucyl-tRNA synthetase
MFMGPLEATKPWSMEGVNGVRGFLDRVWRMFVLERSEELELHPAVTNDPPSSEALRVLHKTIRGVTEDIERLGFNTAIAKMMEFTNHFTKADIRPRAVLEPFLLLLAPFAPHLAEELWQLLGHPRTLAYEPWPAWDEALARDEEIEVPVQVLGKLRSRVRVPVDAGEAELRTAAESDPRIAELLAGKTVVKVVIVPGRLVNFVVQ